MKKDGKVVASREVTTGLRSLKLVRRQDTQGETFYFELNGIPVFAKGVNAIPNDVFLPRISRSDYEKMVTDAANANMNMTGSGVEVFTKTIISMNSVIATASWSGRILCLPVPCIPAILNFWKM